MSRKIKIKNPCISLKISSLHLKSHIVLHLPCHAPLLSKIKIFLPPSLRRLLMTKRRILFLCYLKFLLKRKVFPHSLVLLLHIHFKIVLKFPVLLLKMLLLSKLLMSLLMDLTIFLTLKMLISLSTIHLHLLSLSLVLIHLS